MTSCIILSVSTSTLEVDVSKGASHSLTLRLENILARSFVHDDNLAGMQNGASQAEELPLPMREEVLRQLGVETTLVLDDIPQMHLA